MKCPCEECICIAICKQKLFIDLILKCQLVDEYTADDENRARARARVRIVHQTLKTNRWEPLPDEMMFLMK